MLSSLLMRSWVLKVPSYICNLNSLVIRCGETLPLRLHLHAIQRAVRNWNFKNLVFELTDLRRKVRRLHNAVGRPVLIAWLVSQRVMSFPLPLTLSNSPPPGQHYCAQCEVLLRHQSAGAINRVRTCRSLCEWQCMCTYYQPPLIFIHAAPVFISLDTFLVNTLAF